MKKRRNTCPFLSVLILVLTGVFIQTVAAQDNPARTERIRFAQGASAATASGTVRGTNYNDYIFSAREGQEVSLKITSKQNVNFTLLDKSTMLSFEGADGIMPSQLPEWTGTLPKTGEYVVRVFIMPRTVPRNRTASYTLELKISGATDEPADIYGSYVSDGYARRDEGFDWVAVSVSPVNDSKAKISVRSRADRKKPTCTFDGNASISSPNVLKYFDSNNTIVFRFAGKKLSIEAEPSENKDKLYFFCSGGASLGGEYMQIEGAPDSRQIDKTSYYKSVMMNNYRFNVEAKGGDLTIFAILDGGTQEVEHRINGTVTDVEIGDLNNDLFPEIFVYIVSSGGNAYGSIIGYSVNNGKSISQIAVPEISDSAQARDGYRGGDEFAIVEDSFVRRFPVYKPGDTNDRPTGGMRQILYKLREGEASRRLVADKILSYPMPGDDVPGRSNSSLPGKWQWVSMETPVEKITVRSPQNYTLDFLEDGGVRVLADCNRGTGSYTAAASSLRFSPIAATRKACPAGSLDAKFLAGLDAARIFRVEGDALFIDLLADGGTMRFVRTER